MIDNTFKHRFKSEYLIYQHSRTHSSSMEKFVSHAHSGYEIIYIVNGNVSYGFEEEEIILKMGDIIITPPAEYHYLEVVSNEDYERINLIVFPEKLHLNINISHPILISDNNKAFQKILKDFTTYYNLCDEEQRKEIFEVKTRELIFMLKHLLPLNDLTLNSTTNETLKNILNYINSNLQKKITVTDIANNCFLSEGHIFHLFNKKFKTTPMNYIKTKKMLLAQTLIFNATNKSAITDIATNLGFDDYSVFYRNYLKFFHKKPSDDLQKL